LVDFIISVGDEDLDDAYDAIIDLIYTDAIEDDTESPTWNDVVNLMEADPSRFGELNTSLAIERKDFIKKWDRNRDGLIDRDELRRMLFRDASVYVPFSLRGTDYYSQASSGSELFRAIDRNGNRRLDEQEINSVSRSLELMDQNADRRLAIIETRANVERVNLGMMVSPDEAWRSNRSRRDGSMAMDFESFVDWKTMSSTFSAVPEDVVWQKIGGSGAQNLRQRLDADLSGRTSAEESRQVTSLAADVIMKIRVPSQASETVKLASVDLASHLISVDVLKIGPQVMVLDGPGLRLVIVIDDHFERDAIWNGQVRCRAAEIPDPIFAWLDIDFDGSLSEREMANAKTRLYECGDAPIQPEQIPATYLLQLQRGAPQSVDLNFGLPSDPGTSSQSDGPAWFGDLDSNKDGEIAESEFLGTTDQFRSLDQNGDLFLTPEECR
jgi:Ca2+-binding EF-hand superfamily protein